jgi:hypothetical protein
MKLHFVYGAWLACPSAESGGGSTQSILLIACLWGLGLKDPNPCLASRIPPHPTRPTNPTHPQQRHTTSGTLMSPEVLTELIGRVPPLIPGEIDRPIDRHAHTCRLCPPPVHPPTDPSNRRTPIPPSYTHVRDARGLPALPRPGPRSVNI